MQVRDVSFDPTLIMQAAAHTEICGIHAAVLYNIVSNSHRSCGNSHWNLDDHLGGKASFQRTPVLEQCVAVPIPHYLSVELPRCLLSFGAGNGNVCPSLADTIG